jgi:putative ABC transport system permease protein
LVTLYERSTPTAGGGVYETQPLDPGVFAAVAALLMASAALASMVPAWRASRLDPTRVLRME